jgi:hypothetical protein
MDVLHCIVCCLSEEETLNVLVALWRGSVEWDRDRWAAVDRPVLRDGVGVHVEVAGHCLMTDLSFMEFWNK